MKFIISVLLIVLVCVVLALGGILFPAWQYWAIILLCLAFRALGYFEGMSDR